MPGYFAKVLSSLAATTARWVEFSDASTAPVHGAIMLDPATGLPIDTSTPTLVKRPDSSPLTASLSAPGVFFTADMNDYESISFQILGTFTGAVITAETSEDNVNFSPISVMSLNNSPSSLFATQVGALGIYRVMRALRYTKIGLSAIGSGTVQIVGHRGNLPAQSPFLSADGTPTVHMETVPARKWDYGSAAAISTTGLVILRAAGATTVNHLTWLTMVNTHASVDTEVVLKIGTTVRFRTKLKAGGPHVSVPGIFLRGASNQAITFECVTTGAEVYVNAGGFVGQ